VNTTNLRIKAQATIRFPYQKPRKQVYHAQLLPILELEQYFVSLLHVFLVRKFCSVHM
jgi:hypothetical protein